MEALIIQPPSPNPVLLDQAGGRVAHLTPPWEAMCLLSFLRQRTRHRARLLDTRVRRRWEDDLAADLAASTATDLVAIACGLHDLHPARRVAEAVRRSRPDVTMVGFGDLPTLNPAGFRDGTGIPIAIMGDPEPTLRHLLDNRASASRRQRIAAVDQEGLEGAVALWVNDLKTLALPAWSDISLSRYDSAAHPGGARVDLRLSRGAGPHPVDALTRPVGAPLRIGPMDQYAEALQACAHLGILGVHFADPPDVWDSGRLDEWLERLARLHNAQEWSLRLMALPLGESFRSRLVEQRCRRLELLVPSCHPEIAARLGYEQPDARAMQEMLAWCRQSNIQADFVFWVGGRDEPRGEARRINRFVRAMRFPPMALERRPDTPPDDQRLARVVRDVRRRVALSPARRIRDWLVRIKALRVSIDEEHRNLIIRPRQLVPSDAADRPAAETPPAAPAGAEQPPARDDR